LQKYLNSLGELEVKDGTKINHRKSKAIRITRAGVKNPLALSLVDENIPEVSSCEYLGITLRSDLNSVAK
jgi:hypothetical protein